MITERAQEELGNAVCACLDEGATYKEASKAFLREWLLQAIKRNRNNQCALAISEGVHRNTIARLARKVGVTITNGGPGSRTKESNELPLAE